MKKLLSSVLFCSFLAPAFAADKTSWAAVFLDYVNADQPMVGVTIAPHHYDDNYRSWGYYVGYAQAKQQDMNLPTPYEGHEERNMWRLGLSYSLSNDFSIYGGAVADELKQSYTDGVMPMCVECEPTWHNETHRKWGAELGFRYAPMKNLILSAGYNNANEAWLFGIGYRSN